MNDRYFATARTEMFRFLPDEFDRLLDIGCGAGATLAALRERRGAAQPFWAGGVELDDQAAKRAMPHYDRLWVGDAEAAGFDADIDPGSLDVILCLDVLEHLADPWSMVRRLSPLLGPGGRLIVSVPNIRHWKFIWRLLAYGDFHYREAGLLDRTHLRFFVRQTAAELTTSGGLALRHIGPTKPFRPPDGRWIFSKLTLGICDDLNIKQFAVVAENGK